MNKGGIQFYVRGTMQRGNVMNFKPSLSLSLSLRRLLQVGVYNAELFTNLGLCCFYAQQYDMAISCLLRGLQLSPNDDNTADVWYNIGHITLVGTTVCSYCGSNNNSGTLLIGQKKVSILVRCPCYISCNNCYSGVLGDGCHCVYWETPEMVLSNGENIHIFLTFLFALELLALGLFFITFTFTCFVPCPLSFPLSLLPSSLTGSGECKSGLPVFQAGTDLQQQPCRGLQ